MPSRRFLTKPKPKPKPLDSIVYNSFSKFKNKPLNKSKMYSIRPNRTFSHTKTRPRAPLHAPPCSYQDRRYLDTRIQTIIQRYNREVMNDKNKKQLVIDMLSIVTDKDVTNEQIQTCIHYLNDMDAWAVSGEPGKKAWEDVPSPWN